MNIHHLMLKKKEYTYKLKKILEGHDFLYDMIFLISKINDPATLYKIKHVNTNPNSFEYRSFGKENKGESIFFLLWGCPLQSLNTIWHIQTMCKEWIQEYL